ncbi:MAG: hypothetical protein HQ565_09880 [Bacteroidetes bacterium]|nr:hypothetical protein [Bacteroidota bacterium]
MANKKEISLKRVGLATVIIIVGLWLGTHFWLVGKIDRGTYGDMFGSVNALFSGLAFAGIIITILLQSKELALQRDELTETRDVLIRTAKAQEDSEKAMIRQAENLKISAKLSALNTLYHHYNDVFITLLKNNYGGPELNENKKKRDDCIIEIERINALKKIQ